MNESPIQKNKRGCRSTWYKYLAPFITTLTTKKRTKMIIYMIVPNGIKMRLLSHGQNLPPFLFGFMTLIIYIWEAFFY